MVMIPRPLRQPGPLQMVRKRNRLIMRDGVITRIVQIVRPLVRPSRGGLNELRPPACPADHRNAAGDKHTHHLISRHGTETASNDKIHHIVDIRKAPAVKAVNADLAVITGLLDKLPRPLHVACISIQTMHNKTIAGPQPVRQPPITTADMNDQSALNTALFNNFAAPSFGYRQSTNHQRRQ